MATRKSEGGTTPTHHQHMDHGTASILAGDPASAGEPASARGPASAGGLVTASGPASADIAPGPGPAWPLPKPIFTLDQIKHQLTTSWGEGWDDTYLSWHSFTVRYSIPSAAGSSP